MDEVRSTIDQNRNELEAQVVRTDMSELLSTASEIGLTGRFAQHIGQSVSLVFQVIQELAGLHFSDVQASCEELDVGSPGAQKTPDLMMSAMDDSDGMVRHRAIGELKTPWTCDLTKCPISGTAYQKQGLGRWLGVSFFYLSPLVSQRSG